MEPRGNTIMPPVMEPAERDFWIAVTLWGAALVTVFGCGLYAFIEQSFAYGAVFTITGLGGLMYMTSHLRGRRLSPRVGAMATMLAVTWGLIGYQVWLSQNKPAFEAQKSTLIGWLQQAQHECDEARQELAQLQKQMKAARSTPGMMTFPVPGKRQPDPQVCAYLLYQIPIIRTYICLWHCKDPQAPTPRHGNDRRNGFSSSRFGIIWSQNRLNRRRGVCAGDTAKGEEFCGHAGQAVPLMNNPG